jgi:Mg-chelatase subunit ChlI-like protein
MSLALVHSRARAGVSAPPVRVEVHLSGGLPQTHIVGLPEAAVRESRDRVRAAILCAQFEFPARRITVNLAPADLPKDGGRFDLPIALGILAASGQRPQCTERLPVQGHRRNHSPRISRAEKNGMTHAPGRVPWFRNPSTDARFHSNRSRSPA